MKTDGKHPISEFVGKSVEHAEKYIRPVRVIKEDGKVYMITSEYISHRLNVALLDGKIIEAYWG